jgi:hypothetical protein
VTALPVRSGTAWTRDLTFGIRLAMGARRSGWLRLALTAFGTGIGVLVLLFAASVPHVVSQHHTRSEAPLQQTTRVAGVAPLRQAEVYTDYHGDSVNLDYLQPTGANSPLPPGLSRLPGRGEVVLSPVLAKLLESSDGQLLRPRIPGRVVGTIADDGLTGPAELIAYIGAKIPTSQAMTVYGFGSEQPGQPTPPLLLVLVVVGAVVLLFPVFVFVVTAARLSGAERDRRLAAVRLVGADARQIRRIAAGEAVLGAVAGLVIGAGLFLAVRPLVERQTLGSISVFTQDVVPSVPFLVIIVLGIPVLAVGATLFALRRTIIEPLGVVREASPSKRRLWWRLIPVLLGIALLAAQASHRADLSTTELVAGVVALLLGIPLLLPWILQRVVGAARRGTPALQLATGRLRLDSGTPARVVAGVAVVLAGAVALFALLAAAQRNYGIPSDNGRAGQATIDLSTPGASRPDGLASTVSRQRGVLAAAAVQEVGLSDGGASFQAYVAPCSSLSKLDSAIRSCHDGDVFANGNAGLRPGESEQLTFGSDDRSVRIQLPGRIGSTSEDGILAYTVAMTPGALRGVSLSEATASVLIRYDQRQRDTMERIRNAAAPLRWQASVDDLTSVSASANQRTFGTIKRGLYAGALLTLGMAGATMLVLAVEQVRERRRQLAVLAASGVPRSMLARSVLWQNAIPLVIAALVADATGLVLGALLLRIAGEHAGADWTDTAVLTAVAVAVVAAATALTLPAVRRATRPQMLRSE